MRSTSHSLHPSVQIPPSGNSRQRKAYESRREREFYSYYAPVLSLADTAPQLCDLNDPQSVAAHRAVSSPDKALTAFVQLTALRLRTRRSMLFFFDSDYAYILAEATRSLSLQDDSNHDIDDSLWLGCSKIPRGFSVCEVTADLPANDGSNAQDPQSRGIAHIVNNLEQDTRFCDRPFVTDGPMARFYAGVPITTVKGINIGALCVLDEQPRDGMNVEEVRFLNDMATTVMTHLEMVRAKQENECSHDMTTALSAFVAGKSRSPNPWLRGKDAPPQSTRRSQRRSTSTKEKTSTGEEGDRDITKRRSPSAAHRTGASPRDRTRPQLYPKSVDQSTTGKPSPHEAENIDTEDFAYQSPPGEAVHAADALQEDQLGTRIKATMDRAADLFRKAIDVDGVVFLDAAVSCFEGQVSSAARLNETDSGTDTSRTSASDRTTNLLRPAPPSDQYTYNSGPPIAVCPVIGSSYRTDEAMRVLDGVHSPKLTKEFLKSLLRRYPEGRVWHFNPSGEASSDDMSEDATSTAESANSDSARSSTPSSRRIAKRLRARVKDGRLIQQLFPGVRSLILVGMWDSHKDCWFGASILWSYSPTRVLSTYIELPFISAFCEVVLSEVWRVEAQMVDRSKNDFISSISHELRSPLHGILGSAECLEDREHDAVSQELVRSILSCGTTLLDIINQLLQYSHLDNGAQQRLSRLQEFGSGKRGSSRSSTKSGVAIQKTGTSLSVLTEDAVNAACSGFDHQGLTPYGTAPPVSDSIETKRDVTVIMEIDEPYNRDWSFLITPGAWKRICMNLVSNALKYTPSGHIRIVLSRNWLPNTTGNPRIAQITLVVEDTGVGMSQAFQVQNLFRPFRQENSLAQGTGLGLNLVAKLAKAEGGTVHVKSKRGKGTSVRVTLPLQASPLPDDGATGFEDSERQWSDSLVDLFGFSSLESSETLAISHSDAQEKLSRALQDIVKRLGMRTRFSWGDDRHSEPPNLQIILGPEPSEDPNSHPGQEKRTAFAFQGLLDLPSIIICASRNSAFQSRDICARAGTADNAQFLWLPIGPAKLATAIAAALRPASKGSGHPHESATSAMSVPVTEASLDTVPGEAHRPASSMSDKIVPDLQKVDLALRSRVVSQAEDRGSISPRDSPPVFDTPSLGDIDKVAAQIEKHQSPTSSMPLLLVDDNPVNLRILTVFAAKAGYPYISAPDGSKAVEAYKRAEKEDQAQRLALATNERPHTASKPAVILMDINMPLMNGLEASRLIRQFEQENGVARATIIALTGLGSKEAQDESFASGVDLFLTKPVKLKELGAILLKLRETDREHEPS